MASSEGRHDENLKVVLDSASSVALDAKQAAQRLDLGMDYHRTSVLVTQAQALRTAAREMHTAVLVEEQQQIVQRAHQVIANAVARVGELTGEGPTL